MMSTRRPGSVFVAAIVLAAALWLPAAAAADYEQVGLFAQEGNGEQLYFSTGIAVNASGAGGVEAGSVYTTAGNRVSRYSPKGEFKEAWGWNTIASGPDLPNQVNTLTVRATSGTYELTATTGKGSTNRTEGSKVLTSVKTLVGAFHVGDPISGSGIPTGTTVIAVGAGTLELSAAAQSSTPNTGPESISATETTPPIPYDASAAEVKAALVALPAFAPADLSVTGGPGDAAGTTPYTITFEGAYAGSPVSLESTESTLAGGVPSSSASVAYNVEPTRPSRFERCRPDNGDTCALQLGNPQFEEEGVGRFFGPEGVAVDQSTGYVYVLNGIVRNSGFREHNLIEVFSADGSQVIARFGDAGVVGKTFEEGPEKLHATPSGKAGIAVDDSGKVYLTDNRSDLIGDTTAEARVMCFGPEAPGDYEHYVYCGRSQDITLSVGGSFYENISLDNAGHVYVASVESVSELSPAEPSAPPLCTYKTNGQLRAMTANPLTGEVFYYNASGNDRRVHRLKPCDLEKGKFEGAQVPVKGSPPIGGMEALAFNPALAWGAERPAGVLYGADGAWHETEVPNYRGLGYIFAPAEVHPPTVESESVTNTRTTSTILRAEIDPHGYGTHYAFQYLSEAQYEANEPSERFAGATEAPLGGGEIAGNSVGQATAAISGLAPDTAYRFRVVATSQCDPETGEPCVAEGEALAFATYPTYPPGLPDHRAYELVSPAQKHGGEVIPAEPHLSSCESECKPATFGNVFPMQSSPDGEAVAYEGQPFSPLEGAVNYDSYVSRRSATGWQTTALIPALPPGAVNQLAFDATLEHGLLGSGESKLEIQPTAEPGSLTPLVTEAPPHRTNNFVLTYGGHSTDFSRLYFAANDSLTKETPFAPEPPDPGATKNDLYEWHDGQLAVLNVLPGNATVAAGASFASLSPDTHAVSADGSRVFWTDEAGNLYVRENGETTKQVNDPGKFLTASPDGSEVLLTDGCLYSLQAEACTDLTDGKGGFKGIAGQSQDLSHIYFVDTAVLGGEEANEAGEVAEAGKNNLYSWSEGTPRFVVQLVAQIKTKNENSYSDSDDWAANPAARTAEASPSGRYLAFTSVGKLTGYDNVAPTCQPHPFSGNEIFNEPCTEAFLYDSDTGRLTCASCRPTGEVSLGNSYLRRIDGTPERLPQPRYLTDEGRLYFDSLDSLSARDTNEGVEDVYEYEPQGTGTQGTCQRDAGCISLISAGTEAVDSNLIAVDETGKNVFFDTRDRLTLKDKDELLDVYDAREGGGIAAETEVARGECQGESCQAQVSAPKDPTPGSSTFEGAGNVKEEAKAKKHKHAKKKKHAKKHKRHNARAAKRNHGGAK